MWQMVANESESPQPLQDLSEHLLDSHTSLPTSPIQCAIRPRKFIEISSDMKLDNVVIPKEEEKFIFVQQL